MPMSPTRLNQEHLEIEARLAALHDTMPAADKHEAVAYADVERLGEALNCAMTTAADAFSLREQYASARSRLVEARSERDRLRRTDMACRHRLQQINEEIAAWTSRRDQAAPDMNHATRAAE